MGIGMYDIDNASEKLRQHMRMENAMLGLTGLVDTLGIGSAIALLFAPVDGELMRERLMVALEDSTNNGKEQLMEVIHGIEAEYPDLVDRIRQAVDALSHTAESG
jgi:gas vesicle protein